jgi:phosphodiesterase/alkaline phosphatase D-like protein
VVWGRCNNEKDAYVMADVATSPAFSDVLEFLDEDDLQAKLEPSVKVANAATDYTVSFPVYGLRPNQLYYYRLVCVSRPAVGLGAADPGPIGTFHTAPSDDQPAAVNFVWGAVFERVNSARFGCYAFLAFDCSAMLGVSLIAGLQAGLF